MFPSPCEDKLQSYMNSSSRENGCFRPLAGIKCNPIALKSEQVQVVFPSPCGDKLQSPYERSEDHD